MRIKKKPTLTADLLKEYMHYDPETGDFTRLKCSIPSMIGKTAQVPHKRHMQIGFAGHCQLAHRMAWLYQTGELPNGQIDHIDGDPANNRFANLRVLNNASNCQNRHVPTKSNKAGMLGVIATKNGRFVAQIKKDYKSIHLGTYANALDAHMAYLRAKAELHPFAEIAKGVSK